MEQHPVPQNVTTFQFKLVGDMTLKQFIYLATGSSIAYLLFVFASSRYPLISWPLIIISASLGAAFAFLPIQARPLDQWVIAFFKAVYSPTKRIWEKGDKTYQDEPLFKSRYLTYMSGMSRVPSVSPSAPQPIQQTAKPIQPAAPADLPSHQELKQTVDLAKQAQNLQMRIIQTERQLSQIKQAAQNPHTLSPNYSQEVNKALSDLQGLVTQASGIKQKLETVDASIAPPPAITKASVKVIVPEKPKQTQLALTTFPNVINGIIKDNLSNYLDSVVVVIYDKEGLPVRALKTNKLGQFTGSTPLPNGTYKIEVEKDGFSFDVLQIELSGQVLAPLMITSKGVNSS
ncbi:PrgI family protein [Candidatus Daviesbacteria bacterium]|nr:PrgI family protein [Candidatus Daviesbacteria bacterium]